MKLKTAEHILLIVALVGAVLACFYPVINHEFVVYDDPTYIYDNVRLLDGLSVENIKWAFSEFYFANWHPLTSLSYMLDVDLFGLGPRGFHITNLVVHMGCVVLFYVLGFRLTRSLGVAFLAALLFGVHPLRVESVAWISERKDVLSGFFCLLAMLAYLDFYYRRGWWRYALVTFWFALALLSKSMVVTLPVLLLVLDWWLVRQQKQSALHAEASTHALAIKSEFNIKTICASIGSKLPWFLMSLAVGVVTIYAQQAYNSIQTMERVSLLGRINTALTGYFMYLYKFVAPIHLPVLYPLPEKPTYWHGLLAGLFVLGMTVMFVRMRHRRPYLLFAWLWYLIALLPVIGLLQVGLQSIANRYTYIPLMMVGLALAIGVEQTIKAWPRAKPALMALLVIVCTSMGIWCWAQTLHFRNSVILFQYTIQVTDHNWSAHNNLGAAYMALDLYPEARDQFLKAREIKPGVWLPYYNMGNSYRNVGDWEAAAKWYEKALALDPSKQGPQTKYSIVLLRLGRYREAMEQAARALRLNNQSMDAAVVLYLALEKKDFEGRVEFSDSKTARAYEELQNHPDFKNHVDQFFKSEAQFQEHIDRLIQRLVKHPDDDNARFELATRLVKSHQSEEAEKHYRILIERNPGDVRFRYNLARCLLAQGKLVDAYVHARQCVEDEPRMVSGFNLCGTILHRQGKFSKAVEMFDLALAIDPRFEPARTNRRTAIQALQAGNQNTEDSQ